MTAKNGGAILTIVIAVILTLASITAAFAAAPCGQHDEMAAKLEETYGESKSNAGMVNNDKVMEIYTNPTTGTWTVLITDAAGTSCMVAAGEIWLTFEQVEPAAGEPM